LKIYGIFVAELTNGIKILYSAEIDGFFGNQRLEFKTFPLYKTSIGDYSNKELYIYYR